MGGGQGSVPAAPAAPTPPAFLQLLNGFCDTVLHFLVPDRADQQGVFWGLILMLFWELFKKKQQKKNQTQPFPVDTALLAGGERFLHGLGGGTQSLPGQRAQRRACVCYCEPCSLCQASLSSPVLHQQPSWREPAPQAPPPSTARCVLGKHGHSPPQSDRAPWLCLGVRGCIGQQRARDGGNRDRGFPSSATAPKHRGGLGGCRTECWSDVRVEL